MGATPVTTTRDLPHGRVDHALLAPPFPAPTGVLRTTSSSQDQSVLLQPAVRNPSPTSYQPQLAPAVHGLSLFQSYQPPSPPIYEDSGQFSPPPLPIPPPRGPEDSPPPPIETRTSEIIPTRSHVPGYPQSDDHSIPEVQSEMLHLPSQPLARSQLLSVPPLRAAQPWQSSKVDSDTAPTPTSNVPVVAAHDEARSSQRAFAQSDDVPIVHQEIMRSISVLPSQSSAPTRSRQKVTVEDVPEDSLPMLTKGIPTSVPLTPLASVSRPLQLSQNTSIPNTHSTSKFAVVDPPGHRSSPPSRSKDPLLHRNIEPSAMPAAPPMPPPTPAAAPTFTRFPYSAPLTQPTFSSSSQVAPAQRATSHTVPRTSQRAAEILQANKLSLSTGTNPGATGSVSTATDQHQPPNIASVQGPWVSRLVNAPTTTAPHLNTSAVSATKVAAPTTTLGPVVGVSALHASGQSTSTQPPSAPDPFKHQPSRPGPLSIPPLDTTSATVTSTIAGKNAYAEQPIVDSRDVTSSATRNAPSHIYPASARPGPSSATIQQTHVAPAQSSIHSRTVSFPITSLSSAAQKPPSPRKYPQPISSTTVSTQPFPSRPPAPESQPARVPVSEHLSTPAPVRSVRPSPPDPTNDSDTLKTPSSIAPSPMLNPDTVPQSMAVPMRTRQLSTDSKDDRKKGLFGLFRTRTLSLKSSDPPPVSSAPRTSLDQGRTHPDTTVVPSIAMPAPRGATSTSILKELHSLPPPAASTATRTGTQSKFPGRAPDPITMPPPTRRTREHRETTTHLFTPFKFLHSKRNRTVSAASLDVCDGNTAVSIIFSFRRAIKHTRGQTNTVVGSPDHSTVSQAQPLPALMLPGVRDPLVATSEWREREEADRRERKTHRVRRPGVTFDLEEEPPSPAPGTSSKRKKLVRRPSGRAPTPGPPRG